MPVTNGHFQFIAKPLGENRFTVKVETADVLGLVSVITGLFSSYGLDIRRAAVSTAKGKATGFYEVTTAHKMNWQDLDKELGILIQKLQLGKREEAHAEIHKRMSAHLRVCNVKVSPSLSPVQLEIDQENSPTETVISIASQDTPAFLYELTLALALLKINIVRMEIDTVDSRVHDRLWLTQDGEKITSEKKIKTLRWAVLLVKKFTHLLPTTPDPKIALEQFELLGRDLFERPDFDQWLETLGDAKVLQDLSKVLGTSRFLWEELIRNQYESFIPIFENQELLKKKKTRTQMLSELKKLIDSKKHFDDRVEILNHFKDLEMFRIDLRHLLGKAPYIGEFTEEFTDLSEAVVEAAYELAFAETLKKIKIPMPDGKDSMAGAVFGLGKFGGRELGYASDLEILFVYRTKPGFEAGAGYQALEFYSEVVRIFKKIIRAKSKGVFEIDLRLRPFGDDGPLATSLESFKEYYSAKGGAWSFERQALIKLRWVGGDPVLGKEIEAHRDAFVFSHQAYDFKEALLLRARQQKELTDSINVNAKYSSGGLLDVEYLVQTLQIAYGQTLTGDIRHPNTLKAMRALWQTGVLTERQFQEMRAGYIFLRGLINALRIVRGHAKDLNVPKEDSEEYVILARRLGFTGEDKQVRAQFKLIMRQYMDLTATHYEKWMEKLAQTPWEKIPEGITAVAEVKRVSLDDLLRGDLDSAQMEILEELDFTDVPEAVNHFKRLCPDTPGFEYFAKAMDQSWNFWKEVPDPNLSVKHWVWFVERLMDRDAFWQTLSRNSDYMKVLLILFGSSRYLSDLVIQNPDNFSWIGQEDHLAIIYTKNLLRELSGGTLTFEGLRELRHRETLRLALLEMLERASLEDIYKVFSDLADLAVAQTLKSFGLENKVAVMGLGKLGGQELNFSSDIDLIFVGSPDGDDEKILQGIEKFTAELKKGNPLEFLYRVDLRLRPHGDHGKLYMNVEEYRDYYQSQAELWEYQALIKARFVAGRKDLAEAFLTQTRPLIWHRPWTEADLEKLRDIKKQYEARTKEEGEFYTNIKLGSGGIRDIEFAAQIMQLLHARNHTDLCEANTLKALERLKAHRIISQPDHHALSENYKFLRRIENKIHLFENRQTFILPKEKRELRRIAKSLGFSDASSPAEGEFARVYKEKCAQSREIFKRLYYGKGNT